MCIAAATLLSGLVSAAGTFAGSRAQSAQLSAQAKFGERQAEIERERGNIEAQRKRREGVRVFGGGLAQFARNGVALSGSPTAVLSDLVTENELDTDVIRQISRAREDQLKFTAGLKRSQASAQNIRGFLGAASPIINALRS